MFEISLTFLESPSLIFAASSGLKGVIIEFYCIIIESAIENAKAVSLPPSPIITDNIGVSRFNLVDINSLIENARPEYSDLRDNSG